MNKLKDLRVYLSGPMDYAPDGGKMWREKISPILKNKGVVVLDPCNKPLKDYPPEIYVKQQVDKLKEEEKFDEVANYRFVRNTDLRLVDISDFLIAYIDLDIFTTGTWDEIFTGNSQKKAILVVCKQGKKKAPNWLFWTIPHQHIFSSFEELLEYLEGIDDGTILDNTKRWVFFDKDVI